MEPISMEPKRVPTSWWIGQQPNGFTKTAAKEMAVVIPVDFAEIDERVFVKRQHLLSAVEAIRQNKQKAGLRHAVILRDADMGSKN